MKLANDKPDENDSIHFIVIYHDNKYLKGIELV
jgi:hypothetical protein